MKILIVDDNKNNRMILSLLLEDYTEDNHLNKFEVDEAEDGEMAFNMCQKESYDMIFMDIMMPNMDGIDATQAIRKIDSKVMIIAVSAVDDGDRKKSILNSGAEDYISKPINSDVFVNRMLNYIVLVESRNHKKANKQKINLYTDEVYSRHTTFILDSEDSLSEFWEFFLLNVRRKCNHLSDIVRTIFSIVEKQLDFSRNNTLYIEESETTQYFTLVNIETIPKQVIKLLLKKNSVNSGYKLTDTKLSFEILKETQFEEESEEFEILKVPVTKKKIEIVPVEEIASPVSFESSKSLEIFDYMEEEDLYDLEDYASRLNSIMLIVGSGGVTEEEVMEIYAYLEKIGSILSTYSEVYVISQALSQLAVDMSTYVNVFIENSEALGPICKAFSNDMSKWIEDSFHTGAPSVDFMNDTIVVNCQTIGGMLRVDDTPPDDDFDDIFDF